MCGGVCVLPIFRTADVNVDCGLTVQSNVKLLADLTWGRCRISHLMFQKNIGNQSCITFYAKKLSLKNGGNTSLSILKTVSDICWWSYEVQSLVPQRFMSAVPTTQTIVGITSWISASTWIVVSACEPYPRMNTWCTCTWCTLASRLLIMASDLHWRLWQTGAIFKSEKNETTVAAMSCRRDGLSTSFGAKDPVR